MRGWILLRRDERRGGGYGDVMGMGRLYYEEGMRVFLKKSIDIFEI